MNWQVLVPLSSFSFFNHLSSEDENSCLITDVMSIAIAPNVWGKINPQLVDNLSARDP